MGWKLKNYKRLYGKRHMLEGVICQIKFKPILKMESKIADVQDKLRKSFPEFSIVPGKNVNIDVSGNLDVVENKNFVFKKIENHEIIFLNQESIGFENKNYTRREDFIKDIDLGIKTLLSIHKTIHPVRLGIRFINNIDKDSIQKELKKPISWKQLVNDSFLHIPKNLSPLENTLFLNEYTSSLKEGAMTIRYGLLKNLKSNKIIFRFDIDRYIETFFNVRTTIAKLNTLFKDTHSMFQASITEEYKDWMKK